MIEIQFVPTSMATGHANEKEQRLVLNYGTNESQDRTHNIFAEQSFYNNTVANQPMQ